jgi:serine/threonine protein kinase
MMAEPSNHSGRDEHDKEGFSALAMMHEGANSNRNLQLSATLSLNQQASASLYQEDASGGEDGPYRYMSPELFQKKGGLSPASDVFSFGMILYHLFEAIPPFANLEPEAAAQAYVMGKRPDWGKTNAMGHIVPKAIKEMVASCCHPDPLLRMTLPDVIRELQETARRMKPSVTERPRDLDEDDDCCTCFG